MKILGAVLVVLACGGTGFIRTGRLSRQITQLDMLCMQVWFIQTELCQRGAPLPEVFRQAEDTYLRQIADELRNGKLLHEAARPFLQHIERGYRLSQGAKSMERLFHVLGRYDSITQAAACNRALEELEKQKATIQQELSEKGRLYRTVPLAFGLMVALAVI